MARLVLQLRQTCFIAFSFFLSIFLAQAKAEIDSARVQVIAATLPRHASGPGPSASHRGAWDKLAAEPSFQQWLQAVAGELSQPLPQTSDELFLDYSKTGNRTRWQDIAFARRRRLTNLALAECLENKGAFLPRLEAAIRDICAEPTWVFPAHDRLLENFQQKIVGIDLGSSRLGWELAAIHFLLADKLSKETRSLIQEHLQRRILKPYRDAIEGRTEEMHWMRGNNNWNAVCHAGVVGAALTAIDSPQERAQFIAAAEFYLPNFLSGFGADGYCSEGLGYWNYGFGHFVMLSEVIRQATGGKVDFMADPQARLVALFGQRIEIVNGIYPSIADCHPGTMPDRQISAYIFHRFQNTSTTKEIFVRPDANLMATTLFSFLPEKLPALPQPNLPDESSLRTWFAESGVLICRPQPNAQIPFAVSLKGGHNNEHHNHNDLGSFIVVAGNSTVLVDPGSEVYTARTFSGKRYESDVLNSFGHGVPVVAGKLQRTGAKAQALVLNKGFTDKEDALAFDLTSAYSVPTLVKIKREFTFRRGDTPALTVCDDVEFNAAETFENALITWGDCKRISDSELLFVESAGAVRVKIDTGGIPFDITNKQLEADVSTPKKATRFGIRLQKPVTKASVTMIITPEKI